MNSFDRVVTVRTIYKAHFDSNHLFPSFQSREDTIYLNGIFPTLKGWEKMNQKEIVIRQELLDKIEGITGCLDSLVNLSTRDMAIIYFALVGQKVGFADKPVYYTHLTLPTIYAV